MAALAVMSASKPDTPGPASCAVMADVSGEPIIVTVGRDQPMTATAQQLAQRVQFSSCAVPQKSQGDGAADGAEAPHACGATSFSVLSWNLLADVLLMSHVDATDTWYPHVTKAEADWLKSRWPLVSEFILTIINCVFDSGSHL